MEYFSSICLSRCSEVNKFKFNILFHKSFFKIKKITNFGNLLEACIFIGTCNSVCTHTINKYYAFCSNGTKNSILQQKNIVFIGPTGIITYIANIITFFEDLIQYTVFHTLELHYFLYIFETILL